VITALADFLRPFAAPWAQLKLEISVATGLSADALHVHGGLILLALFGLVTRRNPLGRVALAVLFVVAAFNEALDLTLDGMGSTEATLGAGLHDLVNTMIGPLVLALASWLVRRRSSRRNADAPQGDEIA
jgi:uncharacterized protein (TIGR03382 family)